MPNRGKTLTVIALIASTLKEYSNTKMRSDRYARYPKRRPIVKTTLIIVPLSRELYTPDGCTL